MAQLDGVPWHEIDAGARGGLSDTLPRSPQGSDALPRSLLLQVAVMSLLWGLNWPVMKVVLGEVPPWTFRSLCFISAFAGLIAIAAARGHRLLPRGGWGRIATVGLFAVSLTSIPLMLGMPLLPAGRTVVLYYTMPVWSVLLAAWWLGEPLTRRRLVGVGAGLMAVLLVVSPSLTGEEFPLAGVAYVVLGAMSWAIGTVLQKRLPVPLPSASYTAWVMLIGGIPVYALVLVYEWQRLPALETVSSAAIAGVLYNMFAVFIVGWWIWIRVVERARAGVAAISSLLTPVVGVTGGMVMLGERPVWTDLAALAAVTVAMASVMLSARPPRSRA